ncbi:hypothetical protein LTR85_007035 [Meristemomyces frigidus]|nr:hypothetical protein LTR85_007035 [Meristemomyces frigidus]
MRSNIITAVSVLACRAFALPQPNNDACMRDAQANTVAKNFEALISAYTNATANAVMTADVVDYSDSVISLMDSACPTSAPAGSPLPFVALGTATFDSRSDFEAGQGGQPNITFELLNVWHNCDTVTLRWRSSTPNPGPAAPATQEQVTGIVVLETKFNGWQSAQPFLIQSIFSEFNSGAWLYDLEVLKPSNCSAAAKRDLESSHSGSNARRGRVSAGARR